MRCRLQADCRWSSILSRLRMPLLVFCLWAGLMGQSIGGEQFASSWYDKEFRHLLKVHQCEEVLVLQHQKDGPFYELVTDEVFVVWCRNPPRPSVRESSLTVFHLIVLTRESTHPWAKCPKLIRFDTMTNSLPLWMERPTQLGGKTLMLDELFYHQEDLAKPLRPGPKGGIKATGPSLWIGDRRQDTSWFLYCHQGAWLTGGGVD